MTELMEDGGNMTPPEMALETSDYFQSSFGDGGDSFMTSIMVNQHNQRQSSMYTQSNEEFTSVNHLHKAFLLAIGNMPSRLQVFDVMDEWMLHIERSLGLHRHCDVDIPEHVYQRLQGLLKKEYETWDLIRTLYFGRLNVKEEADPPPFDQPIYDKYHLDEMTYAQGILRGDKSLQEMQLMLYWLELNYSRKPDPDLTQKLIAWEQTLESLKRDSLLGKPPSNAMINSIDPDAPTRENKHLHPLDADEEMRILRGAFHYLRTGNVEKAVSFLHESGHVATASAILGACLSQKESVGDGMMDVEEDDFFPSRPLPTSSEYPAESNLQPKPHPDFIVNGNPARDLWKSIAWSSCEQENMPKWQRAVFGTSCAHRQSMLDVAKTWEDKLWAYLKAALDTKVEEKLRTLNVEGHCAKLPSEYWSQGLNIQEIFEKLENPQEQPFTIDYMFQCLQQCTMTDDLNMFLRLLQGNIESLFADADHPVLVDHLTRFLTHIFLAFGIVELPYSEQLANVFCEAYIGVLVKNGLFVCIPFYVQKMSNHLQIAVIVNHINMEHQYSSEEIKLFLQAAAESDLDLLGISVAIVDKMRDEMQNFDVDTLQWIIVCYPLVDNSSAVMLEFLRYTVWISRKYLTLGDLDRVRRLVGQVTQECVDEVDNMAPNLVREFICYREYLEAEDALQFWKTARSQKPYLDEYSSEPNSGSLADRAIWEKKKREFESADGKWRKAVDFHAKTAIDAFMKILKFPDGGWLRNCCNPSDEDETLHINAVRRIVMKKVTFMLLNLIRERNNGESFKEFLYTLTENHRIILEEFTTSEIGSVCKVVEEFTRLASPTLMTLPK